MFTSRAEHRLLLREDNADMRLTPKAKELNLIDDDRWYSFENKRELIATETQRLKSIYIHPNTTASEQIKNLVNKELEREYSALDLLRRPEINYQQLMLIENVGPALENRKAAEQVEIQLKYAGYIEQQQVEIERQRRHEETQIPENFDYQQVKGLSAEVYQKFLKTKPTTLGQASRIPGITPAAVSLLLVYLKKKNSK